MIMEFETLLQLVQEGNAEPEAKASGTPSPAQGLSLEPCSESGESRPCSVSSRAPRASNARSCCATRDSWPSCGIRGSCVSLVSLSPNSTHSPSFWPVPDLPSAPAFSVPRFSRLFRPRDPDHGKATEWPHAHPRGPTRARPHPSPGFPAAHREEEEEEETKPLGARQSPSPKAGNQAPAPVFLALPEERVPA